MARHAGRGNTGISVPPGEKRIDHVSAHEEILPPQAEGEPGIWREDPGDAPIIVHHFASAIYGITLIRGLFLPNAVPVFALAIVLLLGLLILHFDLIARPNRWILPGAAAPSTFMVTAGTPGLPAIPGRSYRPRPPETMARHEVEDLTLVSETFTFAARP